MFLRAIENFGHRPSQRHFSSSAWKTLPMLRRRDDRTTFLLCETLGRTDGILITGEQWVDDGLCRVQSFMTFQALCLPTSHRCDEMHGKRPARPTTGEVSIHKTGQDCYSEKKTLDCLTQELCQLCSDDRHMNPIAGEADRFLHHQSL